MLTKKELPQNPAVVALWLLGNKWTLYILQHLLVRPHSFGELRRSIDGISDKVLSDNLKKLQANEIIYKSITSDNPPRSYYSVTVLGKSLLPVIDSLSTWGAKYLIQLRIQTQYLIKRLAYVCVLKRFPTFGWKPPFCPICPICRF